MLFHENSPFKNIFKYFTILEYLNAYFIFSIVVIKYIYIYCLSISGSYKIMFKEGGGK